MAQERSIIPKGKAAFNVFFKNMSGYVTAMTAEPAVFPHIPPAGLVRLNQKYAAMAWQANDIVGDFTEIRSKLIQQDPGGGEEKSARHLLKRR
jgi:hypothetical protein